ncbi:mitochondrial carrier protein RIM2 [Rhodotorula toruloides]|uniref:Mitochondrial carrier protein RIM2 n=1 Tax=Rhodotorula toruloides TaxID=5286 RepID=A0A511K6Y9_RHOTO|nr:mitochondrial carrier protein RIM2 [Rhodotorula toruloides]
MTGAIDAVQHPHPSNPALTVPLGQPLPPPLNRPSKRPKPPPVVHLVAGGAGGMCGAIVTAPFDVVKTRLQSDLFAHKAAEAGKQSVQRTGARGLLWNFVDTGKIMRDIARNEGPRALFKGLGPTLAGAVPARSINFFVYGNGKHLYAEWFNGGKENTAVHLAAAATAGIATAAATNPIWVVKTDMQLRHQQRQVASSSSAPPAPSSTPSSSASKRPLPAHPKPAKQIFSHSFRSASSPVLPMQSPPPRPTSWSTSVDIFRSQGLKGFYRGLSASLLGVTEGTIQWSLYEQFKRIAKAGQLPGEEDAGWRVSAAAGSAKFVATVITYPHEVVRTRLRQPLPPSGVAKYKSLGQTFSLVIKEEGWRACYHGLTAHLMRVIPNACCMYFVYETLVSASERRIGARFDEEQAQAAARRD